MGIAMKRANQCCVVECMSARAQWAVVEHCLKPTPNVETTTKIAAKYVQHFFHHSKRIFCSGRTKVRDKTKIS